MPAAPTTAIGLTVVLGFVGLGIDVGHGYLQRRTAQHAADSAAFSGAAALTANAGDAAAEARAVALRYGFDPARVTVNMPPATGPNAGKAGAVEVLVERPGRRIFSALFGGDDWTIRARAVGLTGRPGDACVLALNASASASALYTGSADILLNGCSLFANSTSPTALELKGAARINAKSVGVVGGFSQSNNSSLTTAEGVHTGQAPIADPYADVKIPDYSGCDTVASLSTPKPDGTPRVLCSGLTVSSGQTLPLAPGVYVVKGGLTVNGGGRLVGSGVTLALTSDGGSWGRLKIDGNATIDLSAPTTGSTAGLVFFQDRRAPADVNTINGGANFRVRGAMYFPSQTLRFSGGALGAGACTQLVASGVEFVGNANIGLDCAGTGVRAAGGRRPTLVE